MPYIPQENRSQYDLAVGSLVYNLGLANVMEKPGELTYVLYLIAKELLDQNNMSYANASKVLACFADTQHEIRRQILDPYEDKKRIENGDVGL